MEKKKKLGTEEIKELLDLMTEKKVRRIKFDAFGVSELELTDLAFLGSSSNRTKASQRRKVRDEQRRKNSKSKTIF
jgi:hypothetical protein